MSSWKKASKTGQKFHKERGQVVERNHVGFLEKKKDYKLRANDFQKKREILKYLKQKSLEKNPDEFYFNMVKTQSKHGIHQLKNPFKAYNDQEIRLIKTQDKNYIQFHHQMESKKLEKLKSSINFIDVENAPKNQHQFFVDNKTETKSFNPIKQLNTHAFLINRKSNRLQVDQLKCLEIPNWLDDQYLKESSKKKAKKYKELVQRVKRTESLSKLENNFNLVSKHVEPEDEYDENYKDYNDKEAKIDTNKTFNKITSRKR